MSALDALLAQADRRDGYSFAYLDEPSKREIRRALLKAVCVPGHQVPFASRDMPVARGWGSGGLQVTLATIVPTDTIKVYDQGDDDSLNAKALRGLIAQTTGVATTTDARQATLIQTRHRIPEDPLGEEQIMVFQVPIADPLRVVSARPSVTRRMHAEGDYEAIWLYLYEDHVHYGRSSFTHSYPVRVNGGYVMITTPIPRWDAPRLHQAPFLSLFGAGREARVFVVPPYTEVVPLRFEDRAFEVERFDAPCARCGSNDSYLTEEHVDGRPALVCSDTDWCRRRGHGR
ncbi:MAG: alpha-D-ribose 1-methylphosphonate 5-phosphate lyase [Solirubrobacteraceae bacterium]